MAIPALPADDSDSNDWNASKVNVVYDHLQLWRDTRPLFKGQAHIFLAGELATSTTEEIGHGGISATFEVTPTTNISAFTVASGANADGYYNIEVPEAGHYEGFWHVQFSANTSGYRQVSPELNSVAIPGSGMKLDALSSGVTWVQASFEADCTSAGDELSVSIFQSSGSSLAATTYLFVKWVQST